MTKRATVGKIWQWTFGSNPRLILEAGASLDAASPPDTSAATPIWTEILEPHLKNRVRQVLLLVATAAGDSDYHQKNIAFCREDYIIRIQPDGKAGPGSASWTAVREAVHQTKKYLARQSEVQLQVDMRLQKKTWAVVTKIRVEALACHAGVFPRCKDILMKHRRNRREGRS